MIPDYSDMNRWPWVYCALFVLLFVGHAAQAQIYNTASTIFSNTGLISTTGVFKNAGTFIPKTGTLTINSGDFLNTGTITSTAGNVGSVTLIDASATRTLALGGQSIPNLSLNVPAGTTMTSSGTVTGTLTMTAGLLNTTNAYALTLAPTALVTGESSSSYVVGHLLQTQALSGNSTVNFGQMGFTSNPAGQSYNLTTDRRAGMNLANISYAKNPNNPSTGIDRIWAVSGPGSATPATIVLSWLSANDNGLTFSGTNAQVWRSDNNGTSWVKQNAVANGEARTMTITTTGLTSSLYTVATTASPLPVELLSFRATKVADNGQLNWQTASEKNAAFAKVQSSVDGSNWAVIGKVQAVGNTTILTNYSFLDIKLSRYHAGRVYYRLQLVDRDNTLTYSPLVSLVPDGPVLVFRLGASPNPFNGLLTVQLTVPVLGDLTLIAIDGVGKVVFKQEFPALSAGAHEFPITALAHLPTGIYTLVASQGTRRASQHLIHN